MPAGLTLRACMIDGFGVFDEADYRRSWLFFDDVDYVLPAELAGPIAMPDVERNPLFTVQRAELSSAELAAIVEATRRDLVDGRLRRWIRARVPAKHREYASALVWSDARLEPALGIEERVDPELAVDLLANKLLWICAARDAVPIVGTAYAAELLARKVGQANIRCGDAGVLSPRGALSFAAFAAGLAMDFISDEQLVAMPERGLVAFKEQNRELLDRHQLHLVGVALSFAALPEGEQFDDRLRQLRLEALAARRELEEQARQAWLTTGLELGKKAVVAASTGLFSGLAVLRGGSLADLVTAALPAAAAAGGVLIASLVDQAIKSRARPTPPMAYLFRASEAMGR